MPLREPRAKILEIVMMILSLEIAQGSEEILFGEMALLDSEDYEIELRVKRKRCLKLIKGDKID